MAIEDTSKRDPLIHLAGAMAEGPSGYTTGQEADGQRQLVNSTAIPTDGPNDELEALGFKLGAVHEHDPMFRDCELPEGWRREGSEHAMWSYIVDAQGYQRVAIFYKAAFYDRRADFHVERMPRTKAQADAWTGIAPAHDALWFHAKDRREGPNYVYQWRGRPPHSQHPMTQAFLDFLTAPLHYLLRKLTPMAYQLGYLDGWDDAIGKRR